MPDRSRTLRTQAVVLRRIEYGEADLILTLLTPKQGKISAIARAARRPSSKSSGHVELYSLSDMLLAQGANMYVVTQVNLINPFLGIGHDLERMAYASHFVELIDRFTVDSQENQQTFNLLVNGLTWLSDPKTDLRLIARYFEFRLLTIMGYAPSVFECAVSGEKLEAHDQFYSVSEGGVVSADHVDEVHDSIPLPLGAFKVLRHFSRSRWKDVQNLTLSPATHAVLERILLDTIAYLLERKLQSIAFLKRISNITQSPTDPS